MNGRPGISKDDVLKRKKELEAIASAGGYRLNPDAEYTDNLIEGLLKNEARYGYESCPCRVAAKDRGTDRDIICPCDYRDPDLSQYGICYCGLYVSAEVAKGEKPVISIPERRPPARYKAAVTAYDASKSSPGVPYISHTVWRCSVCGYLCARDNPPELCPICKVPKERFDVFIKK